MNNKFIFKCDVCEKKSDEKLISVNNLKITHLRELWRQFKETFGVTDQEIKFSCPKGFRLYQTNDMRIICVCKKCNKKLNSMYVNRSSNDIFNWITELKKENKEYGCIY